MLFLISFIFQISLASTTSFQLDSTVLKFPLPPTFKKSLSSSSQFVTFYDDKRKGDSLTIVSLREKILLNQKKLLGDATQKIYQNGRLKYLKKRNYHLIKWLTPKSHTIGPQKQLFGQGLIYSDGIKDVSEKSYFFNCSPSRHSFFIKITSFQSLFPLEQTLIKMISGLSCTRADREES
jgi:hypothetical protein